MTVPVFPAFAAPGRRLRYALLLGLAITAVVGVWWMLPNVAMLPDPTQITPHRLMPPNMAHPFGTDHLGRDNLSRLVHGGALTVGLAVVALSVAGVLGLGAGLAGGYWAHSAAGFAFNGLCQGALAIPPFWGPLIVIAIGGRTIPTLVVALAANAWPETYWVIQREIRRLKTEPFVAAARGLGYGPLRILLVEILPHLAAPFIWITLLHIRGAVMLISTLAFLGLGPPPPAPSWGLMIAEARTYFLDAWWLIVFPTVALAGTVLGASLVATRIGHGLSRRMFAA